MDDLEQQFSSTCSGHYAQSVPRKAVGQSITCDRDSGVFTSAIYKPGTTRGLKKTIKNLLVLCDFIAAYLLLNLVCGRL